MKSDGDEGSELAAGVVKCIHESDPANRVVVESFDLPAIAEIKRIDAGIRTAALFEPKLSRPISTIRRLNMVDLARRTGADEIALHYTLASPRVVKKAREYGLETVVWTVDDPQWIRRACSLGIKALISNDPATMVRQRNDAGYSLSHAGTLKSLDRPPDSAVQTFDVSEAKDDKHFPWKGPPDDSNDAHLYHAQTQLIG